MSHPRPFQTRDPRQILGDRYDAYLETFVENAQRVQDLPRGSDQLAALAHQVHDDLIHLLRMDIGQYETPIIAAKRAEAEVVASRYSAQTDDETLHQHACRTAEYVRLLVLLARTPRPL
ncbi:hypothetical protein [Streptomyces sp. NPDC023327]|uniref:hypothetical protein n=1 Tax=Streptomyces sp. NPDC023327 TaxID=3157088 RepID=UPI0033C63D96